MNMKRLSCSGQAMLELLMGIIALLVILVGIVTFGEAGYYWLSATTEAAGDAWTQVINEANMQGAGRRAPPLPLQQLVSTWGQSLSSIDIQNQNNFGTGFNYTMRDQKTYYNGDPFFDGATGQRGINEILSPTSGLSATNYCVNYRLYDPTYVQRNLALLVPGGSQNDANMFLMGSSRNYDRLTLGRIGRQDGMTGSDYRGTSGRSPLQVLVYDQDSFDMHTDVYLPPIANVQ